MSAGEKFRKLVADALARSGKGVLAFEVGHGLKPSSIKAIVSPSHLQTPSIDKAEVIAKALGFDFHIGDRPSAAPARWYGGGVVQDGVVRPYAGVGVVRALCAKLDAEATP